MSDYIFKVAYGFYVMAFIAYFIDTFIKRIGFKSFFLITGLLIQTLSLISRTLEFWVIPENRYYIPINSFYGSLFILNYIIMLNILFVDVKYKFSGASIFLMPFGLLAGLVTFFLNDKGLGGLVPALRSYWINLHPVILFIAYSFFGTAFSNGVIYIIANNQLKKKNKTMFMLPSLEHVEKLQHIFILYGYPILSAGIILGGIWAFKSWGRFWGWDPKETWSFITWLVYTIYLHIRVIRNIKGVLPAYINIIGFACVLFTYIGVNFLSKLHGYLSN